MNERTKEFFTEEKVKKTTARIKARILRYGYGHLGEDCAQEFFCRVLQGKSQHQTVDQFVIDYLRECFGSPRTPGFARRKAREHADSYEQGDFDRTTRHCDGTTLDDRFDLFGLVNTLRGRDREIAVYSMIWGMSEAEVADRYKVTESRICQILKRIQGRLSERIARPRHRLQIQATKAMAKVLFGSWQRMEFETHSRLAFEEPRALEKIDGYGYEKWIA